MTLPQHDEIHIISDLHMGGRAGFQILRETGRLAAFVRWVAGQRPKPSRGGWSAELPACRRLRGRDSSASYARSHARQSG